MRELKDHQTRPYSGEAPPEGPAPHPGDPAISLTRRAIERLFGPVAERRFHVQYWDGSTERAPGTAPFTLVVRKRSAIRRMLLPPNELSLVEAYLFGDLDVLGDLEAAADLGDVAARRITSTRAGIQLLRDLLALPAREADDAPRGARIARRLSRLGRRHSPERDAHVVRFHYDVGNAFYALWLDPQMVYSCGYFPRGDETLEAGQRAKLDLVCRKLRLKPGERLLDIGCGWGALPIHAAREYGVHATGITVSEQQAAFARDRVAAEGLGDRVSIELRDYRTLRGPQEADRYDKIASVGMVEHVGERQLPAYFEAAHHALRPGGLFLNHGIISRSRARPRSLRDAIGSRLWGRNQFIRRYVFPDGEILPLATVIRDAEAAGLEARDAENLREHYVTTLRHWVRRLEASEDAARAMVGDVSYRVWRLYMAASAYGFRSSRIGVVQTLLAKPDARGEIELPRTREDLYTA